jgi:class 3 adenylate cyclase
VRGQLYQQNEEKETKGFNYTDASTRFVESGAGEGMHIASKFEKTTVMFADLAGFTKWSSSRSPENVFDLLEALFRKFDAAAKRLGAFKVETM